MSVQGCNRLCATCSTVVHDLSELSVKQVEELLDVGEDVCVRAFIGADGVVRSRDGGGRDKTRIVAAIGGSLSLAIAACQTVQPIPEGERYAILGEIVRSSDGEVIAISREGWEFRSTINADGSFAVTGVPPSTYSVSLAGECMEMNTVQVVVADKAVDLGELDWDETGCFIIGVVRRVR